MDKAHIDITKDLSVYNFQRIASVILKDGDRKTYCNKYNNSPHYKVDSFDVYLDPVSQFTNWSADKLSSEVSDYNAIVLHDSKADIMYYHVMLKGDSIVLKLDDDQDGDIVRKLFLGQYLPIIINTFNLNEKK